ncbi:MAG TPA: hypothetical protein VL943_05635 [Niabella sp.]|nr:hypothetical protein [Niabella sp.]
MKLINAFLLFFLIASCSKQDITSQELIETALPGKTILVPAAPKIASNSYDGYSVSVSYSQYLYRLYISVNIPNFSYGGSMTYLLRISAPGVDYIEHVNTSNVEVFCSLNPGDMVSVTVSHGDNYHMTYYQYQQPDGPGPFPPTNPPTNPPGQAQVSITPPPSGGDHNFIITSNTQNTNISINWNWQNGYTDLYYYFIFQIHNPDLNHTYTVYDSAKAINNSKTIVINRFYTSYNTLELEYGMAGVRYTPQYPFNKYYPGNPVESRYVSIGGNVGQTYTRGFFVYSYPFVLNNLPMSE